MNKVLLTLIGAVSLAACTFDNDPRLVVVVYDGARWQEVYNGADPSQITSATTSDSLGTTLFYTPASVEENRSVLMPFAWSHILENGVMLGNRNVGSKMEVSNICKFSYPGYSESLCGWADNDRVNSNDYVNNPNHNVLEAANADPRYSGSIQAFAAWRAMSYILNEERSGYPVMCGRDHFVKPGKRSADEVRLDELCSDLGFDKGDGTMPDYVVTEYALASMRASHPKVVFIAFDEPDHFPHEGQYDGYLEAMTRSDKYLKKIWEFCEGDRFYKGKTTYIVTADHGRGSNDGWRHHGSASPESEQTWLMAFGKGIPAKGVVEGDDSVWYNKQIAPSIARILGVTFTPDNGTNPGVISPIFE